MALSPQHANYSANSTRARIKRSPRWDDDEGVAATVGTIMALLVFLTFFGMFTNQFVPVWMSDNESSHMSSAIQQFATLKSSVDITITNYANSIVAPAPIFVPITLSASGIPVFAAPTAGILTLTPEAASARPTFDVSYTYYTGGLKNSLGPTNDGRAGGDLDLYCPNRYYVEQHLIYENGAVILNQSDGEFIIAGPQFSVKNTGTAADPHRTVLITQVSLQGTNKTVGGTGSKGLNAEVLWSESNAYQNNITNNAKVWINITSKHGIAWANYFNSTLNGLANMTWKKGYNITIIPHVFADKTRNYYEVKLSIDYVRLLDHTKAILKMSVGELGV